MTIAQHFTDAKQKAVALEPPNRVLVEFTGGDRARFLHNFCTNDIQGLAVNTGCEVIFTNIKARAMGHGYVFAGETSHWLETSTSGLDELLKHLDKYLITDDVEFKQRDDLQQILVTGPDAVGRVAAAVQAEEAINPLTQVSVGDLCLRRVDCFNEPGILIAGKEEAIAPVRSSLNAIDCGETYEAVRVEAGFPLYGTDFSADHMAPEVGRIKQAISYKKGCYLGQEPIARLDALGHVNKSLCPVESIGAEAPAVGSAITNADGEEVGTFTSSVSDPIDARCYGLAWLKYQFANPGTELTSVDKPITVRG
ncbi:MAG: folate-binding protein YgfZ [Planctomycetaceae bacterium]